MTAASFCCQCCQVRRTDDTCSCVYTLCRRCVRCLTHCCCTEKHARDRTTAEGLDDPAGPFANLAASKEEE
jgi:hypothetical protein